MVFATSVPGAAAPMRRHVVSVAIVGHGDGPGIGMGQWGAFGYAVRYHFSYARILAHFYGSTKLSSLQQLGSGADPLVSVLIVENLNLRTNLGYDPVVTSSSPFLVSSTNSTNLLSPASVIPPSTTTTSTTTTSTTTTSSTTTVPSPSSGPTDSTAPPSSAPTSTVVSPGMAVDFRLQANGTWSLYEGASCALARQAATANESPVLSGLVNPVATPTESATGAPSAQLILCRHDGVDEALRGSIEAYDREGYERTVNVVSLDNYLEGVVPAEMSPSWGNDGLAGPQGEPFGFQALEAQAIAARSYLLAAIAAHGWNGYVDTCDTALCQAYVGTNYEYAVTDAAVRDTSGAVLVLRANPRAIATANYSASTGGWTAPSSFRAVPDLGDACVVPGDALQCNPLHYWRVVRRASDIVRHFRSVGSLVSLRVIRRDHHGAFGGRSLVVRIIGTRRHLVVKGSAFASAIGLPSDWFAFARLTSAWRSPPPHRGVASTTTPSSTSGPATSTTKVVPPSTSSTTPAP